MAVFREKKAFVDLMWQIGRANSGAIACIIPRVSVACAMLQQIARILRESSDRDFGGAVAGITGHCGHILNGVNTGILPLRCEACVQYASLPSLLKSFVYGGDG